MLMTIIMEDAANELDKESRELYNNGSLAAVLYADDTLLVGVCSRSLEKYLAAVADVGAKYRP